jgi:hypothetical protein
MRKIIATVLFIMMISSSLFGETPAEKGPATLKPFTEIVADMGERISVEIPDVYDMAISVKYKISEDKKTCKAHMTIEIIVDEKTLNEMSKEEIEEIILGSLTKSMKGNVAWAFFLCRVSDATIEYNLFPVKKTIGPEEEKIKTERNNLA